MSQRQRRLKILIVDDNQAVCDILSQLCSFLGHEVLSAKTGAEGLDLVQREADVDMVFADYKMPVMDGVAMVERIKAQNPNLPVVLITGSVGVTDSDLKRARFDAMVHKPFELKSITECIERFFPQTGEFAGN